MKHIKCSQTNPPSEIMITTEKSLMVPHTRQASSKITETLSSSITKTTKEIPIGDINRSKVGKTENLGSRPFIICSKISKTSSMSNLPARPTKVGITLTTDLKQQIRDRLILRIKWIKCLEKTHSKLKLQGNKYAVHIKNSKNGDRNNSNSIKTNKKNSLYRKWKTKLGKWLKELNKIYKELLELEILWKRILMGQWKLGNLWNSFGINIKTRRKNDKFANDDCYLYHLWLWEILYFFLSIAFWVNFTVVPHSRKLLPTIFDAILIGKSFSPFASFSSV